MENILQDPSIIELEEKYKKIYNDYITSDEYKKITQEIKETIELNFSHLLSKMNPTIVLAVTYLVTRFIANKLLVLYGEYKNTPIHVNNKKLKVASRSQIYEEHYKDFYKISCKPPTFTNESIYDTGFKCFKNVTADQCYNLCLNELKADMKYNPYYPNVTKPNKYYKEIKGIIVFLNNKYDYRVISGSSLVAFLISFLYNSIISFPIIFISLYYLINTGVEYSNILYEEFLKFVESNSKPIVDTKFVEDLSINDYKAKYTPDKSTFLIKQSILKNKNLHKYTPCTQNIKPIQPKKEITSFIWSKLNNTNIYILIMSIVFAYIINIYNLI